MSDEVKQPTAEQLKAKSNKRDPYGYVYFCNLENDHLQAASDGAQRGYHHLKDCFIKLATEANLKA